MSDDVLSRAARALRDDHGGSPSVASATRLRVLASAATQRRRHFRATVVLVPIAAVLALSTAWAAVTGRVGRWVAGLTGSPADTAALSAPASLRPPPPPPTVPPSLASATPVEEDAASPVELPPPPQAPPRASPPRPRPVVPPPTDTAAGAAAQAEEDLYATAHRAHFASHDPAAALKAWDAYLAAYPRGRFALEARYNRALSLVRLGRTGEARAALAPFADGSMGGYRQREARELVDALDAGAR